MKIVVPIKLESEANPRRHGHWAQKSARVRGQRQAVTAAFIDAGAHVEVHALVTPKKTRWVSRWKGTPACSVPPFAVVVTITRVAPRALDDDNLARSAKAVRDQVAELLGVDDRDPRVTWRYAQERGAPNAYACSIAIEARP